MSEINNSGIIDFGQLDTNVESRLGLHLDREIDGGLARVIISEITLTDVKRPTVDSKGVAVQNEFAGLTVPELRIPFIQVKDGVERFIDMVVTPVSKTNNNGIENEPEKYTAMIQNTFAKMQHVLNVFNKGGLPNAIGAKLDVKFDPNAPTEAKIASYKKLFKYFFDELTGSDSENPRYKGAGFYLKALPHNSRKSFYVVPDYVQKGFLEVIVEGKPRVLELGANESIELQADKSEKEDNASDFSKGGSGIAGGMSGAAPVASQGGSSWKEMINK